MQYHPRSLPSVILCTALLAPTLAAQTLQHVQFVEATNDVCLTSTEVPKTICWLKGTTIRPPANHLAYADPGIGLWLQVTFARPTVPNKETVTFRYQLYGRRPASTFTSDALGNPGSNAFDIAVQVPALTTLVYRLEGLSALAPAVLDNSKNTQARVFRVPVKFALTGGGAQARYVYARFVVEVLAPGIEWFGNSCERYDLSAAPTPTGGLRFDVSDSTDSGFWLSTVALLAISDAKGTGIGLGALGQPDCQFLLGSAPFFVPFPPRMSGRTFDMTFALPTLPRFDIYTQALLITPTNVPQLTATTQGVRIVR